MSSSSTSTSTSTSSTSKAPEKAEHTAAILSDIEHYTKNREELIDIDLGRAWLQTSEVQNSRGGVMAHTLYYEVHRCNATMAQMKKSSAPTSSSSSPPPSQQQHQDGKKKAKKESKDSDTTAVEATPTEPPSLEDDEAYRALAVYHDCLCDTFDTVSSTMLSSLHRSNVFYHVNKQCMQHNGSRVVLEDEEPLDSFVKTFLAEDVTFHPDYDFEPSPLTGADDEATSTARVQSPPTSPEHNARAAPAGGTSPSSTNAPPHKQQAARPGSAKEGTDTKAGNSKPGSNAQSNTPSPSAAGATSTATTTTTAAGTEEEKNLNVEGQPKSSKEIAEEKRYAFLLTLLRDKKVRDEKGLMLNTVGPFSEPKVVGVRNVKMGTRILSRKTLQQRASIAEEKEDDEDLSEEAVNREMERAGPSSEDASLFLREFLKPASLDSLKKISESAKARVKGNDPSSYIHEIVRCATRMGNEQLCMLMERCKALDWVATRSLANALSFVKEDGFSLSFFSGMTDDMRYAFGRAIGLYKAHATASAIYERMIALGFCAVLTNLRSGPLKRLAQELGIKIDEHATSVAQCEAIVFTAFPRERLRMKLTQQAKAERDVIFTQIRHDNPTDLDLGTIAFEVSNISTVIKDQERHYSPEFEYGGLKWSLLVMAHKENLAIYLCQTGTTSCKFIIWLLHRRNHLKSVVNEGTQHFTCASPENDWGFNNVIAFDSLLKAENGFIDAKNDSIVIVCGIVLVEQKARFMSSSASSGGSHHGNKKDLQQKAVDRVNNDLAKELLETERLESLRKKLRQEVQKVQKDEEKQRKDIQQKQSKAFTHTFDLFTTERQRIAKEHHERERREQQDRIKEQERQRNIIEQNKEMEERFAVLSVEEVDLRQRVQDTTDEIKGKKQEAETVKAAVMATDKKITAAQRRVAEQSKTIAADKRTLEELAEELSKLTHKPQSGNSLRAQAAANGAANTMTSSTPRTPTSQITNNFVTGATVNSPNAGAHNIGSTTSTPGPSGRTLSSTTNSAQAPADAPLGKKVPAGAMPALPVGGGKKGSRHRTAATHINGVPPDDANAQPGQTAGVAVESSNRGADYEESIYNILARVNSETEEVDDQEALMAALQQTLAGIIDTND